MPAERAKHAVSYSQIMEHTLAVHMDCNKHFMEQNTIEALAHLVFVTLFRCIEKEVTGLCWDTERDLTGYV